MSIMTAIENQKSKTTDSKTTDSKTTDSKTTDSKTTDSKTTVDYSTLTVSQKFDALGRLARATSKFIKPELLTCNMSEDSITLAWASEIKGIPVVNMETLEVVEAETFGITTLVIIRLRDMDIMTSSKPVKETEDKVQLALSLKHQKEVFDTLTAVDLGPLTRTRSSK